MMKQSELIIRAMYPKEYPLLREFLYQAIFLPEGTWPPSRSVIDLSKLPIYIADFGTQFGDHCLAAEVNGKIVGPPGAALWRIMAISTWIRPLLLFHCCRNIAVKVLEQSY